MSKKINIGKFSVKKPNGDITDIEMMGSNPDSSVTKLYVDTIRDEHNTRIGTLERYVGKVEEKEVNLDEIINNVRLGLGSKYYFTGDQIIIPYNWSNTEYQCKHNVVDHSDDVIFENNEEKTVHALTLEWHHTIPLGLAFDPDEAMAEISSLGLPAGTYYFKIAGDSWGSKNGRMYEFTLTSNLVEGNQLKPTGSYNSTYDYAFKMRVYADGKSFTALQEVEMRLVTEPSGIYLGELGGTDYNSTIKNNFKVVYSKNNTDRILNHYHCIYLGNNIWIYSLYRQFLNSDGLNWWISQHPCDRAPSSIATLEGFLTGYSSEFKSKLKMKKCITYRNTVVYDGQYDITYDKIFLHSMANINVDGFTSEQNINGLEGPNWEYYKNLAIGQDNLNPNGTFKAWSTYPILIKYALNAQTSSQYVFSRSANRSRGYSVLNVYTSGGVNDGYASSGHRCLPACILC